MQALRNRIVVFLAICVISCNENKSSASTTVNPDSMPVVKANPDSNSSMPISAPKDSTAEMPNPYDTLEK